MNTSRIKVIAAKKMFMCAVVFTAAVLAVPALAATYQVETDKPEWVYRCGETATFTVTVLDTANLRNGDAKQEARLDNFGTQLVAKASFDMAKGAKFSISGTLERPGFLRLTLPETKGHSEVDAFVFSAGFEPEKIHKGSPSPADFDEFWAEARKKLVREVPLDPRMERVAERSTDEFDFYRTSFATFGRRIYGFLSVPKDKAKAPFPVRIGVNAAGFGDWSNDMKGSPDAICAQFAVYDWPMDWKWRESGLERKYDALNDECNAKYSCDRYCVAGITESREAYFFYPVLLGIDRAVDWIAASFPVDASSFSYQGTSQGGGFGFYLCGLSRRFTRAAFYVPAITDTMGYLAGRRSGWPYIVEGNSSTPERRAAAERWAPYFDGANFASRIECPVRVAVGFSDSVCPPCAVYAAYNEIKVADKAIVHGIGMTHDCFRRFYDELGRWATQRVAAAAELPPEVKVGDAALRVEAARCSAMPVNIRWPGHQRELDQTEICSFARFDFRGAAEVRVTPRRAFTNVVVRPVSAKVAVRREGDSVRFTITKAGAYSVEFDGRHRNLMLFADPPRDWKDVDRSAANVRYFGPGEHDAGLITLKTGETLFIDEGAVVYGRVFAKDAPGIRICGKGILDSSRVRAVPRAIDPALAEEQRRKGWAITNVERFDAVRLEFCDDVRIEGVTIRDSPLYTIRPICCDNLLVDNVKIVGNWRYNSDGIDMHNCRKVRIRDSFLRTFDDSICVKGFDYVLPESEMLHNGVLHDVFEDVVVERCTIWNDWGRALEIGAETRAREIRNVVFRDCDVIALHEAPLDVQNCDQAYVHDIVYENIRIEYDPDATWTIFSASAKDFDPKNRRTPQVFAAVVIWFIDEYSKPGAENRGRVSDVVFRDIDIFAPTMPPTRIKDFDENHRVERVSFERIRLNGKDVTAEFYAKNWW